MYWWAEEYGNIYELLKYFNNKIYLIPILEKKTSQSAKMVMQRLSSDFHTCSLEHEHSILTQ